MQIEYRPADETSAREFLQWQYAPPYDVYNCPPDRIEEFILYNIDPINNVHAMFNREGELVGYCSYGADAQVPGGDYSKKALDIGMMIKPQLTGQGRGADFAREVIHNGSRLYGPGKMRVTIAAFNQRAMHIWAKNGFQQSQRFKRKTDGMEFVIMVLQFQK